MSRWMTSGWGAESGLSVFMPRVYRSAAFLLYHRRVMAQYLPQDVLVAFLMLLIMAIRLPWKGRAACHPSATPQMRSRRAVIAMSIP